MLGHIAIQEGLGPLNFLTAWMPYGHYAVGIFIVVSGYSLMLPVVRSSSRTLSGGVTRYVWRRARRLGPPYYAALALSLVAIAAGVALREAGGTEGESQRHNFDPQNLVMHILLIHNLSEQWFQSINPPLWSVALEWQIYFFLPFVLLPLWRWGGVVPMPAAAFVLGLGPHFLLPDRVNLDWTFPWYLGLFALGAAGAALDFGPRDRLATLLERVRWGLVSAILVAASIVLLLRFEAVREFEYVWQLDLLSGVAAAAFIVWAARHVSCPRGPRPLLIRFLESRPSMLLGRFSCSIYLMHFPVWWVLREPLDIIDPPALVGLGYRWFFAVPVAIAVSYAFHWLVERHFMSSQQAPRSEPATEAVVAEATSNGASGPDERETAALRRS